MNKTNSKVIYPFYIVSTPIGNMHDISQRAIETLNSVDVILCEDTRNTMKITSKFGINSKLESYHMHNHVKKIEGVIDRIKAGKRFALVSDAGTPSISDPGTEIISRLKQEGVSYTHIPGASAVLSAFVLSGFAPPFTFVGFLPNKNKERNILMQELLGNKSVLVFFISPHNLNNDIQYLNKFFGTRECMLAKELTKYNERIFFSKLDKLSISEPRGEYVLVIDKVDDLANQWFLEMSIKEHYDFYTKMGVQRMDAIKNVAKDRNKKKQEIYNSILISNEENVEDA